MIKTKKKESLDHLTAVSGMGFSHALGTCETRQVMLSDVSGGFSRGSPVPPPLPTKNRVQDVVFSIK